MHIWYSATIIKQINKICKVIVLNPMAKEGLEIAVSNLFSFLGALDKVFKRLLPVKGQQDQKGNPWLQCCQAKMRRSIRRSVRMPPREISSLGNNRRSHKRGPNTLRARTRMSRCCGTSLWSREPRDICEIRYNVFFHAVVYLAGCVCVSHHVLGALARFAFRRISDRLFVGGLWWSIGVGCGC